MTAVQRQREHPNLLAGPATPEQTRGLKRGQLAHGAYDVARREPLEREHRELLRRTYPNAADQAVNAQAKRAAMIDLFAAWIADKGVMTATRGKADASGAAKELRLLLDASDRAIAALEATNATAGQDHAQAYLRWARGEGERPGGESIEDAQVIER